MKLVMYTSICVFAIFTASCSKDDSPASPPVASMYASDYWMPTAAGTRLLLEETSVSTTGGITTDSSVETSEFRMMPGTKTTRDGKSAFILQNVNTSGSNRDTSFSYLVLSTASMMAYDDSLYAKDATTYLKAPITIGNTWLTKESDTLHSSITSVTETVVTPAGTFSNCIRVSNVVANPFVGVPMTQDFYLARGVGLVRMSLQATASIGGTTVTYRSNSLLKSKSF